jgi:class 3 adenylate cyclase
MDPQERRIERRLTAIFAADVAGYSRLMEQDEVGTLRALTVNQHRITTSAPTAIKCMILLANS